MMTAQLHRAPPLLGLVLALALSGAAHAAPDVRIDRPAPEPAPGPSPTSEMWEQIRKGKEGELTNPALGAQALIKKPMAGNSDKAVGFTTPVHADFPVVGEKQGQGPTMAAMALLAAVFGGALGVAAMLARNLGRH